MHQQGAARERRPVPDGRGEVAAGRGEVRHAGPPFILREALAQLALNQKAVAESRVRLGQSWLQRGGAARQSDGFVHPHLVTRDEAEVEMGVGAVRLPRDGEAEQAAASS